MYWYSLSFLDLWLVLTLIWRRFSVIVSNIFFCLFFFYLVCPTLCICYTFCNCPTVFGYFTSHPSLCFLCFLFFCVLVICPLSSVQFSRSVMYDSLQPHGLHHARLPCPSSTPRAYSNSCPLSWWCHPTISSSVIPFSSCLQSFPASGSFQLSQTSEVLEFQFQHPSNEFSGLISFKMDWLDLVVVQVTLKSLLQHHSSKAWILWCSAFFIVQLSHPYMTTGKSKALTRWTFVGK